MTYRRLEYGALNPANHPQTGKTLDPSLETGATRIASVAADHATPSFIGSLSFPLKAIVLRVEKDSTSDRPVDAAPDGWMSWHYMPGEPVQPVLVKIRARIPELHAHLPEPAVYGDLGAESVMSLYPVFVAKDTDLSAPADGEVVYVDFADRARFQDPIYLGKVSPSVVDGGVNVSPNLAGKTPREALEDNEATLNTAPPPGEPLATEGQNISPAAQAALDGLANDTLGPPTLLLDEISLTPNSADTLPGQEPIIFGAPDEEPENFVSLGAESQVPVPTFPPIPKASDITCKNTSDPLGQGPSCRPFNVTEPGLYDVYSGGQKRGQLEMVRWVNTGASNKLVLAESKHSLDLMKRDFIEQTGISDAAVIKFINDGFRTHALQSCYKAKYDACWAEWKRQGSKKDKKPTLVGKPGKSRHQIGQAVDFNADGTGRTKRTRTTALWTWLAANSKKYGWEPTGMGFNKQEPWHFTFNRELAKANGVLERT